MASSASDIALKAAFDGNLRLLKKMAKKVDLRGAKDAKGDTVLHFAARKGCLRIYRFQVMRYLIDHGADPAIADQRGTTPLHSAAEEGHCEAVKLLLSKGVPVDPVDHQGAPLHLAIAKDRPEVVKLLLEHGADPNKVVNQILSPLVMSVFGKSLRCMKILIEAGADLNARGKSGPTPLTQAVDDGFTDFIKLLLEAGADPNIPSEAAVSVEEKNAYWKSQGKEAFAKEDYFTAMSFYGKVLDVNPSDATMYANQSLCWLRMRHGELALEDARKCRTMRPCWSKAWYREGAALSFMKDYEGAADAFQVALQLDPKSQEIREALRNAEKAAEEPQSL
ncbi:hypothetical protein ACQ4PT_038618 [Festuca glaucescens]